MHDEDSSVLENLVGKDFLPRGKRIQLNCLFIRENKETHKSLFLDIKIKQMNRCWNSDKIATNFAIDTNRYFHQIQKKKFFLKFIFTLIILFLNDIPLTTNNRK